MTGLLTGLSLLTPMFPPAEMINHFRPFMLLGILFIILLSLLLKKKTAAITSGAFLAFHMLLACTSWSYRNKINLVEIRSDINPVKLITFNINYGNSDLKQAQQFLAKEKADIIVFQEVTSKHASLLNALKNLYPHQLSCAHTPDCNLAILSKKAWVTAKTRNRTDFTPPAIIATFSSSEQKYTIIGTHIAWPFQPNKQVRDLIWLEKFANSRKEPLIIAGDFNHTPWSWRLTRFAHSTGLRRHGTFGASWPAGKLFPAFLIDNIFSSGEVENIKTWIGPDLNSDHLPVISIIKIK